jgi:hypothetical protein
VTQPPKPGDFGVVRTPGLAGAIIRLATRSPVNHAFVYIGADHGALGGYIVEAAPGGVRKVINPYGRVRWSSLELTDGQRASICLAAKATIGRPYNWLDILALGADAFGWRWPSQWRRLNRTDRLICSQDVAFSYLGSYGPLIAGKTPNQVTPGDLLVLIDGL